MTPIDGAAKADADCFDYRGGSELRDRSANLFADAFAAAIFVHDATFATRDDSVGSPEHQLQFGAADFDSQKHGQI